MTFTLCLYMKKCGKLLKKENFEIVSSTNIWLIVVFIFDAGKIDMRLTLRCTICASMKNGWLRPCLPQSQFFVFVVFSDVEHS